VKARNVVFTLIMLKQHSFIIQTHTRCPIYSIQLLTLNSLGRTWRRICLPDIRSVSALEVLTRSTNRHLLTYKVSGMPIKYIKAILQVSVAVITVKQNNAHG